jgi:very-short-patch-repair endonuclease
MPTRAQGLRKNPTPAEVRFWKLLEPLRTRGYHFRKQVPLGAFVADFACHQAKVVIEIDGDTHYTDVGMRKDRVRDAALAKHGYKVLRFSNLDVMNNPEGIYDTLVSAMGERTPSLASLRPRRGRATLPSPQGGG